MNKIMVVEDEAVIAIRLQERLTAMGYHVIAISYSGEEAMAQARRLRPDLILMDIMIPGKMDGVAVAKSVKKELDIPVIFLTAFSEDKIIDSAKQAEPYGYIVKPFQDSELKACVEIALYKKEMEKALKEREENFRTLAENANDGILIAVGKDEYVFGNRRAAEITGYGVSELLKTTIQDIAHPDDLEKIKETYRHIWAGKPFQRQCEITIIRKDGNKVPVEMTSARSIWDGQPAAIVIFRDITERVRAEQALQEAHHELELRVKERTRDLQIKTKSLEEMNIAMKVLLKKREEDKTELENNVLTNVKELVMPFVDKFRETQLDGQQKTLLSIIESNLNEVISPFTRRLSLEYLNLTPTEIKIANMTKHGNTSKNIAKVMNISPRTVDTHKKNIRRKIGLEGKRANLRSYLLSLH
ncbi:MAG TPA: PAS domain S-box protein [Desulfobacterales bacterium]|nr:PAS domain S-box protein [Desulfobacterales bacterium]